MTRKFEINTLFARENKIPVHFVGNVLVETAKAVYIYGRGTTETRKTGQCAICGRALTHPVSVLLGVGPECGGHWYDWNSVGGYTKENLERLRLLIEDIKIDQWIPKSCVKVAEKTEEEVITPEDHKMLKKPEEKKEIKKEAKAVKYQNGNPAIKLTFPFQYKTVEQVKSLSGRKYHGDANPKFWTCPMNLDNLEKIRDFGFVLDNVLLAFLEKANLNIGEMKGLEVKGLEGGELMPFQKKGVEFIEARNGRVLLADEMGLGKTIQALAWLQLHPELRPAIVVCPATLKWNWANETRKWLGKETKIEILTGSKGRPLNSDTEIVIINYDILPNEYKTVIGKTGKKERQYIEYTGWVDYLTGATTVILDEAHFIKNDKAQRTEAAKKLCQNALHVLALSGTPATSRPIELYNALSLVDRTVIPDFWKFVHRYCGAKHNGFGWDFTGATNTEELHQRLVSTVMIRRTKDEVLADLPAKMFSHIPMDLENEATYLHAESDFLNWVRETKGAEKARKAENAEALVKIEALKQLAVQGKMKQALTWIEEMLDTNGKLVVFAIHTEIINMVMEKFGKQAVKIDGSITGENRQKNVEAFQNDDNIRLLVGNIKAAGTGITLTASANVAFLEFPWTPGELSQAEDRCHRIGQDRGVNVYYLVAQGTIEEGLARMLDKKKINLEKILDGREVEEEQLIWNIINGLKNKKEEE